MRSFLAYQNASHGPLGVSCLAVRVAKATVALMLVAATGCLPDPKKDPCRSGRAAKLACEDEPANAFDAGDELPKQDAAVDADTSDGDGMDSSASLPDAGTASEQDATVAPDPDASMEEVEVPEDAAVPVDAGPQNPPLTLELEGDLAVHDPTIIEENGSFIIISTGAGLPVKRSTDLRTWENDGKVFEQNPAWIAHEVPGARDLWAPDIAYYGGKYHLYYSASTFGSRNSCIGHATATDLTTMDFVDHGPVICTEETDNYNAIDPGFVVDEDGNAWLSFGSFWSGIKLIRLDASGNRADNELYSLASRHAVEAVEAPYVIRRGTYYYLFVSFDLCCRGTASTYRIMVGRSKSITGPYVDADGKPMLSEGGGTGVVLGNQRWRGPGHNAVLTTGDKQYLVYHAYDAEHGGAATLRITELVWDSAGWPVPGGP